MTFTLLDIFLFCLGYFSGILQTIFVTYTVLIFISNR